MTPERLVLIDGSAVAYRSYFAFIRNPLINSRGENTGAVFGFVNSIQKVINDFAPNYMAVVFDTPAPTFRHRIYPKYKSTRAQTPDDLVVQFPWIEEAVIGFRIPVIRMDGYEADDLIGTLALKAADSGLEVLLFTGDKDFYQLVNDKIKILHPKDYSVMGPSEVKDAFGVPPDKIIDTLALMGDNVDNVPGIPGIGPKTAISLINEFGNLDSVLERAPLAKKGKLAESISKYSAQAKLSRDLVIIDVNSPVEFVKDEFKLKTPDNKALADLFRRLEYKTLTEKFAVEQAKSIADAEINVDQPKYKVIRNLDTLDVVIKDIMEKGEVAIDTETTSLKAIDAQLVGISLSYKPMEALYIPVGHNDFPNLSIEEVIKRFDFLLSHQVRVIGQNSKYDRQVFKNYRITKFNPVFDTMIAAYLINPGKRSYNLDSLALEYLDYKMIPIESLIGSGKKQLSFAGVSVEKASVYSCEDADVTLRLKLIFQEKLNELDLMPLFENIEMPLVPVLGDVEETGVRIDVDFLSGLSKDFGSRLAKIQIEIYEESGVEFNINSPQQLGKVLFDKLKLSSTRRTAKALGRATSVDVLEKLAQTHIVPKLVLEYRQLAKLKSTYIDALPELVHNRTGRVHTSFNQTIAVTGRLSSTDPNLQNIPIRTEEGREIRRAFTPTSGGYSILSADYSQIELRIMAHFSDDPTMIRAFRQDEDIHRRTAAEVYGISIKDVTDDQRRAAKTANFALIYGVSAYGLSQQSELSLTESKDFIDVYFDRYPGIKKYMDNIINSAKEKGFVTTLFGRRRYLPDIKAQSAQARQFAERTAINTPIQGTAADMIKLAMIKISRRIQGMKSKMILQVHDELVFDAFSEEINSLREIVQSEMEGAVTLKVPIKVDIGVGSNWLEAH